jgi:hypothetical protein
MKKGETIQKLVLFGVMAIGAVLVAEAYLQARAFVARVDKADRHISLLKQEVDALRVQLDMTLRPVAQPGPLLAAAAQPAALPIPEPMRLPLPAPERRQKLARAKDVAQNAGGDEPPKSDAVPDDGKVVLLKESKVSPTPAATPATVAGVDVKLLVRK